MNLRTALWLAALRLPRGAVAHLRGDLGKLAAQLLALERPVVQA